ncbi:MAG: adenosine deaminase [Anaerolineae bacterium]
MNTADFIQRLPKAELHLHLEGAIPWGMVCEYADGQLAEIPAWWMDDFRYVDFIHFGTAMRLGIRYVLTSVELYQAAARAIFESLVEQNVRYVEISFSANLVLQRELSLDDVVLAIKEAMPDGLNGAVYAAFNRERTHTMDDELVLAVLKSPADGIDLHGLETLQSAKPYAGIFELARERGYMTKAHAGELQGPASIWEACQFLKVRRLEHGTRSVEDEVLVKYLADEQITLDMCPTSNYKLRVVDSISAHPIRRLLQKGVRVTVNTDDPTYFGCRLTDELNLLVDQLGFTLPEVAQVEKNAFEVVRMNDDARAALLSEVDALVSELG